MHGHPESMMLPGFLLCIPSRAAEVSALATLSNSNNTNKYVRQRYKPSETENSGLHTTTGLWMYAQRSSGNHIHIP
jgi:hypothetical protein